MNYAIRDYVVLVIPDWFSLAFLFVVFAFAMASSVFNGLARRGFSKLAEKCAEAADGYARSDEVIADGFEQWDRPDLAADARARAVQHREMAQQLRDRNRRRGWKRRFVGEKTILPGTSQ